MRVLYLTHRLPFAPNRGDRIRSFHLLEGLRAAADVSLVSLVHDAAEAGEAAAMTDRGVNVSIARVGGPIRWIKAGVALAGSRPLTHVLLDSPDLAPAIQSAVDAARPDVVVAFCSGMAKYALRRPLDRIPFVLDMVDVDSEKWRSLAQTSPPPKSWVYAREARVLADFERVATERAVTTLVISERERVTLTAMAPSADIRTVTSGIDLDEFRPPGPPPPSSTVVFCGVMNYEPNIEAAVWMVREVWPLVIARRPDARLQIVGSKPTTSVRALAGATVTVTGAVPHTRDYLWTSAVAVAPLLTARGLQNKVLEALAAGTPMVVTPVVRSGLPDDIAAGCATAATPQAFADAVVALLDQTPAMRRARATSVNLLPLSWSGPKQQFVDAVRAAARTKTTTVIG